MFLEDARDSLAYWEARQRRLPRYAVRRRREAREMAARWRARVAEAERAEYGRGLLGAMLMVLAEQRLPETARHRGRVVARRTGQAAAVMAVSLLVLFVAAVAVAMDVLLTVAGAL